MDEFHVDGSLLLACEDLDFRWVGGSQDSYVEAEGRWAGSVAPDSEDYCGLDTCLLG